MRILVTDSRGMAVVGADATWSPLRADWDGPLSVWPWVGWDGIRFQAQQSLTDSSGSAVFDGPPPTAGLGSVIWITHPDHAAHRILVEDQPGPVAPFDPVVLDRTGGISALVLGPDGAPAPGATLYAVCELDVIESASLDLPELRARRALLRSTVTGTDGRARLPALPGRMLVACELGSMRARPWRGTAPAEPTFSLVPCFQVSGRAVAQSAGLQLAGCTVTVVAAIPSTRRTLARAHTLADGTFGPLDVPLLPPDEAQEFCFELAGERIVPTEEARPRPQAGERLFIEIPARLGVQFPVRVVDSATEPVRGADVEYVWQHAGSWQHVRRASDAQGNVEFGAAQPGDIWLRVNAPGFLESLQSLQLLEAGPTWVVTLQRAGTIQGRCTHAGQPVEDFMIVYWSESPRAPKTFLVQGSRDGRYELGSAPLGAVSLFAHSEKHPPAITTTVEVSADSPAQADFELPAAGLGRGRVIDLESGQGIAQARVQAWVSNETTRTSSWGLEQQTDAEGRFELAAFGPTGACVEVGAPGYGTRYAINPVRKGDGFDFGEIGLARTCSVEVELVTDAERPPNSYYLELRGADRLPSIPFPSDGRLVVPDVAASKYQVVIARIEDRAWFLTRTFVGRGGERVRVVDRRGRDQQLEIVPAPGTQLPAGGQLLCTFRLEGEPRMVDLVLAVPADARVDIGAIPARSAVFTVQLGDSRTAGYLLVKDLDRAGPLLRLQLGEQARTVRVVSRDKQPLPAIRVKLYVEPGFWFREMLTDTQGEARFEDLPIDRADVLLSSGEIGHALHRDVELKVDPVELFFDLSAALDVRLADGSNALPGVLCNLATNHASGATLAWSTTDSEGHAPFRPLNPQTLILSVDEPGLWPTVATVTASDPPVPTTVQVRRLGAARVRVRQAGLAVHGLALEITSEEFGVAVADWAAAGRVRVEPAALRTGQDGELRLEGLPRGPYRWTATAEDGTTFSGRFEVPPRARAEVEIALP